MELKREQNAIYPLTGTVEQEQSTLHILNKGLRSKFPESYSDRQTREDSQNIMVIIKM